MSIGAFAKAAGAQMIAPEWRGKAGSLLLLLTVTNALMAQHDPRGGPAGTAYTASYAVQAIGLVSIAVALLRAATNSPRKHWAVDAGFWLFLFLYLVEGVLLAGAAMIGGATLAFLFVAVAAAMLLFAPLSAWQVAAAVETPLAARPGPWLRGIGRWLVPLGLLLLPLAAIAALHSVLGARMILEAGGSLWLLAAVNGLLGTFLTLATLALRTAAYREVARG